MRRIIIIVILVLSPLTAFATEFGSTQTFKSADQVYGKGNNAYLFPGTIIGEYLQYVFTALFAVFFLLIVYAGFLWMTAVGKPEQVDKAKKILVQAVIGLMIWFFSYLISYFILNTLQSADPLPPVEESAYLELDVRNDVGEDQLI